MPLRMLEVYTDVNTYVKNGIDLEGAVKTVSALQMYLVENGYYLNLRRFINERLPPGIDVEHLPPLAQTSLDLTLGPVKAVGSHPALVGQRSVLLIYDQLLCIALLPRRVRS